MNRWEKKPRQEVESKISCMKINCPTIIGGLCVQAQQEALLCSFTYTTKTAVIKKLVTIKHTCLYLSVSQKVFS